MSPPSHGPTHPYMLSSPGCWSLYGELMASGAGQMAVDAYAVQHPGVPERRAVQSVAVHLISLCAAFELQWPPERSPHLLRLSLAGGVWNISRPGTDRSTTPRAAFADGWPWLAPDPPIGTVTVFDVLLLHSPSDAQPVRAWAEDVWDAYAEHHATVRGWLDAILESDWLRGVSRRSVAPRSE